MTEMHGHFLKKGDIFLFRNYPLKSEFVLFLGRTKKRTTVYEFSALGLFLGSNTITPIMLFFEERYETLTNND